MVCNYLFFFTVVCASCLNLLSLHKLLLDQFLKVSFVSGPLLFPIDIFECVQLVKRFNVHVRVAAVSSRRTLL